MFQGNQRIPNELFSFLDHTDLALVSCINQQFAQESRDERTARCIKHALQYFHRPSQN